MIEWVTVEGTKTKRQHAVDPESPLRAGIYRRAKCGHEVAVPNVIESDLRVKRCTGCARKTRREGV